MTKHVIAVALLFSVATGAAAQTRQAKTDVTEKTLQTLKSLAFSSLPTRIRLADKREILIDKSDPSKIIVPDADARDIIKAAHLTARAHKCDLQEAVIINRDAIVNRERAKKKWSDSQIQYINQLHLYTVQLLLGKLQLVDSDKAKPDFDPDAKSPMPQGNVAACSDKEKQEILTAVEANEKRTGKS